MQNDNGTGTMDAIYASDDPGYIATVQNAAYALARVAIDDAKSLMDGGGFLASGTDILNQIGGPIAYEVYQTYKVSPTKFGEDVIKASDIYENQAIAQYLIELDQE